MRIRINFEITTNDLSLIDKNQHQVTKFIHNCLGENNKYHNTFSNYCVSRLIIVEKEKLAYIVVSSPDLEIIKKISDNAIDNKLSDYLSFTGIFIISEKFFNGENHFFTLTPILLKQFIDKKKYIFLTLNDNDFEKQLTEHTISKLKKVNPELNLKNFKIVIENNTNLNKVVNWYYNKGEGNIIKNVASFIQLTISCDKKIAELLYEIGLGNSTGNGFGTIYKTENKKLYNFVKN